MRIGVSGASGHLGAEVVRLLTSRPEHEVVGISRSPAGLPPGIEGRLGDYDQPETLATAYAGLDRLLIIPSANMTRGVRSAQNVVAIDAAVAAGVGHVVFMSTAGVKRAEDPDIFAPYFVAEQRLMATATAWTLLRMNYFAESFVPEVRTALDTGMLTGVGESRVAYVSRDDVAAAAAGILAGDGHDGAIYTATGPAAISGAERAAISARASGRPLQYAALTLEQVAEGMKQAGLPPDLIGAVLSIRRHFNEGAFDIVTGDVAFLSGKAPRTLEQVLSEAFI